MTTNPGLRDGPWPVVKLGDVLTPNQLEAVRAIINAHADPLDAIPTLRAYLDGHREALLEKGLLADYLAYAIVANVLPEPPE